MCLLNNLIKVKLTYIAKSKSISTKAASPIPAPTLVSKISFNSGFEF